MPEGTFTLAKALAHYFDIPASKLVSEFKALTPKDKDDFRDMLAGEGYVITPAA